MDDAPHPGIPDTRARLEAALLEVMAAGDKLTHDRVAEVAGVARRTVYRYFPDQTALRQTVWRLLSPAGGMPTSLEDLLESMADIYGRFDARAAAMTVASASAEGRAVRNLMKPERVAAYRSAFAEVVADLAEPDRTWAIAAMQLLCTGLAWREMRDQWDMAAPDIAVACRWAIETLLADLRRRGGRPLSEGPADVS